MGCCQSQCADQAKSPPPKIVRALNTLLNRSEEAHKEYHLEKEEASPLLDTSGDGPIFGTAPKPSPPTFGGVAFLDGVRARRDASSAGCVDNSGEDEARVGAHLSYLDRVLLDKRMVIATACAGSVFRVLDTALDVRTAVQFFARGHLWWGSLTVGFLILSPVTQFMFIRSVSGQWRQALPYLVPGGMRHIRKEMLLVKLAQRLSQAALFRDVHVLMGVAASNGALAGIECLFESLPQACVQAHAYYTESNADPLNYASLMCSCVGAVMGVYFGFKAFCRRGTSKAWDPEKYKFVETSHALARGDYIFLSGLRISPSTTAAIAWLLSQEGAITVVDVSRSEFVDPCLKQFECLCPDLEVLDICKTNLTDDGVKTLALYCVNLQSIFLNGTRITNDGVQRLVTRCTNLECLDLGRLPVTDECVQVVATHCKQLIRVDLDFTQVTDIGINAIAQSCTNLRSIDLEDTRVTDVCVESLALHSRMLSSLLLDTTAVTDRSVIALAQQNSSLQRVNLAATYVTILGVQELTMRCRSLRFISLSSSRMPGEQIASVRQEYPRIEFMLRN